MTPVLVPIAFLLIRLLLRKSGAAGSTAPVSWRRVVLMLVKVGGAVLGLTAATTAVVFFSYRFALGSAAAWSIFFAVLGAVCVVYYWPWSVLYPVARGGHFRLVYYLARGSPVLAATSAARSWGLLLSGLALAYRSPATGEERDFIARRLAKEKRGFAVFGAALAMWYALEARAARDEGRLGEAFEFEETARGLFGTLSYCSSRVLPGPVRELVDEYLALDSARRGYWGGLENLPSDPPPAAEARGWRARIRSPRRRITPTARALRAYLRERLAGRPREPEDEAVLAKLGSPIVKRLFERKPVVLTVDTSVARGLASKTYLALRRYEAVGHRATVHMLSVFDTLFHPAFPENLLPEEIRADEGAVASVHDDVAATLAEAIAPFGVPFAATSGFGPVSARVHQRLEQKLFDDLAKSLAWLDERCTDKTRLDAKTEWLEVSRVRLLLSPTAAHLG